MFEAMLRFIWRFNAWCKPFDDKLNRAMDRLSDAMDRSWKLRWSVRAGTFVTGVALLALTFTEAIPMDSSAMPWVPMLGAYLAGGNIVGLMIDYSEREDTLIARFRDWCFRQCECRQA